MACLLHYPGCTLGPRQVHAELRRVESSFAALADKVRGTLRPIVLLPGSLLILSLSILDRIYEALMNPMT